MTRKITVNLYMTLDGYGEFSGCPGSDVVSAEPGEGFKEMWIHRYDSVATVAFGRRSLEGHVKVHSEGGRKPTDPKFLFEFSRWLDRCNKVVLSHSMSQTNWQNSRTMGGDLGEIVARLKAEPGKDIIVDGGPSLAHEFTQRKLADDNRMLVMPVVLGHGHHYWGSMTNELTLRLQSVKGLPHGELILHYETVRWARPMSSGESTPRPPSKSSGGGVPRMWRAPPFHLGKTPRSGKGRNVGCKPENSSRAFAVVRSRSRPFPPIRNRTDARRTRLPPALDHDSDVESNLGDRPQLCHGVQGGRPAQTRPTANSNTVMKARKPNRANPA